MRVSESLCLLENETDASLGAGLSPTQENIYHQILRFLAPGSICVLKGIAGMGKSTVLRALAHAHPAAVLSTKISLGYS
jgi:ABC-type cobalamin/Fe3+-siderophores transport system ATPase subunit